MQSMMRTVTAVVMATGAIALAQELPCWKSVKVTTACNVWQLTEAPSDFCDADWDLNMDFYIANRSGSGWDDKDDVEYECHGTYWTTNPATQACDVEHTLSGWQTAGTQATGNACPSGPPQ